MCWALGVVLNEILVVDHFGSVVSSFFVFHRWLMWQNIVIS